MSIDASLRHGLGVHVFRVGHIGYMSALHDGKVVEPCGNDLFVKLGIRAAYPHGAARVNEAAGQKQATEHGGYCLLHLSLTVVVAVDR